MTGPRYDLTLFVSGASDLSARAVANATALCSAHLPDRHRLTVVDVHESPEAAVSSQVLATPTLVRNRPLPVRKVVGDLSNTVKVLTALKLPVAQDAPTATR
jgi:circadian clock protein KaiB